MSRVSTIPPPPPDFVGEEMLFDIRPRDKRSFNTVLDAEKMLSGSRNPVSSVRYARDGDDLVLDLSHPVADGGLREQFRFAHTADGLVVRSMSRDVYDGQGRHVRSEQVPDFRHDALGMPLATYPEVALPFLLGWMIPHATGSRSVYAWINDRFIAKVYLEVEGRPSIRVGGRTRDTIELVMFPDLNDWVPLGAMLTRLAKPFLPKYRMWYERAAPHRLVRFEGPYGPPGAPEVVLEIAAAPRLGPQ